MNKLKEDIKNNRIAIIAIITYLILMKVIFNTLCPFVALFHINCPGCGLTRASILIIEGKFMESLSYNPTAIFWLISIACFIIDRYFKNIKIKPFPYMFIITSLITIFWYITKIII